jgi:outer membrane lipoprotein-sorting protein
MKRVKRIIAVGLAAFIAVAGLTLAGCKEKDPLKEAQKNLQKASENVKKATRDATKDAKKAVDKTIDNAENLLKK